MVTKVVLIASVKDMSHVYQVRIIILPSIVLVGLYGDFTHFFMVSPTKQCESCSSGAFFTPQASNSSTVTTLRSTTLKHQQQPTFADWYLRTFWATFWLSRNVFMIPSSTLQSIPIAGFCWTVNLAHRQYMEADGTTANCDELHDYHHRLVKQIVPSSSLAAMAAMTSASIAALIPSPSSPSSPSTLPSTSSSTMDQKNSNNPSTMDDLKSSPRSPLLPSSPTSPIVGGASLSSIFSRESSNVIGRGVSGRQLLNDLLPVTGWNMSQRSTWAVSMNDELERLLGYSHAEMASRVRANGWTSDICKLLQSHLCSLHLTCDIFKYVVLVNPEESAEMWQHIVSAVVGIKSNWSLIAHLLTKVSLLRLTGPSFSALKLCVGLYVYL
jgi:hypothetical protein